PTVTSVATSGAGIVAGTGNLNAGDVVTLTVNLSEAVTVVGGTPTLTLNDGGTASYTSGSGSKFLTFRYTIAAGQNTADLAVTAVNLGKKATVQDLAGNNANLTGAVTNPAGTLQIDSSVNHIVGDNNANSLVGTPAKDWIEGRGGNDTLHALAASDLLDPDPGFHRSP